MGAGNWEGVRGVVTQGEVPREMACFLSTHLLYYLFESCFVFHILNYKAENYSVLYSSLNELIISNQIRKVAIK